MIGRGRRDRKRKTQDTNNFQDTNNKIQDTRHEIQDTKNAAPPHFFIAYNFKSMEVRCVYIWIRAVLQ
jgi:hypothetical protein